jgi:hypothetical protein
MNKLLAAIAFLVLPALLRAQPVIDTLKKGKEVNGSSKLLRLHPRVGEPFRYHIGTRSIVTAKNSDELLEIQNLRPDDKSSYSINYFLTATLRKIRSDGASDFQVRIDSVRSSSNDNGKLQSFNSNLRADSEDPLFVDRAMYAGHDLGIIVDTLGNFKEVYGFYGIIDRVLSRLDDSLKTSATIDSISSDTKTHVERILHHVFCYLPSKAVVKNDSSNSSWKENVAVWSTLEFPMQKEYTEFVSGIEERNGKTFVAFRSETAMTPVDRVLEEPEYHTTLPNYSFLNSDNYYVDCSSGMLAHSKWVEDQSYGLKIESKLPGKSGKNFVTVQHSKVESIVELMQ